MFVWHSVWLSQVLCLVHSLVDKMRLSGGYKRLKESRDKAQS